MLKIVTLIFLFSIIACSLFFFFRSSNTKETLLTGNLSSKLISRNLVDKKATFPALTLDQIFSSDHEIKNISKDSLITIIATGDIIPARSVNFQINQRNNPKWPLEKTAEFISSADLTFSNLETPLLKNCPLTNEGMIFCGSDKNVEGLLTGGVDVVSLANNHAGNHGTVGVVETADLLNNRGIDVTGTEYNNLVVKEIKGVKFAFLGFNDISKPQAGISNADEEKIKAEIALAKKQAVVVVIYHWGVEYRDQPDERQKYLGRLTIDAGADLVIGNHPHWIQPIEIYQGKLITYAHGNFIFDQEWSQATKEGVVGKYTFYGKDLIDVEYFPVKIVDYGQPYFLEGEDRQRILDEMEKQSLILNL